MVTKDPFRAHAKLSASGAERWLKCPASVRLSDGILPQDNEHSIRGTNTHTLMQFILEHPTDWHKQIFKTNHGIEFKKFIGYDQPMLNSALVACEFVWDEMIRMKKVTGLNPQLFIEQKVKLNGVGFGTSDVILYQKYGLLHVIDFKNGKYKVDPENNWQGLYYAVAAADLFDWYFSRVWITIVQPNSPNKRGPIRTWKTTTEQLEWAQREFKLGAKRTQDPRSKPVPDRKYCYFCPAYKKCPAQSKLKNEKIMGRFTR